MKEALGLQIGTYYVANSTSFPQFYALDILQFGIQRRIPTAIRLAEQVIF